MFGFVGEKLQLLLQLPSVSLGPRNECQSSLSQAGCSGCTHGPAGTVLWFLSAETQNTVMTINQSISFIQPGILKSCFQGRPGQKGSKNKFGKVSS